MILNQISGLYNDNTQLNLNMFQGHKQLSLVEWLCTPPQKNKNQRIEIQNLPWKQTQDLNKHEKGIAFLKQKLIKVLLRITS